MDVVSKVPLVVMAQYPPTRAAVVETFRPIVGGVEPSGLRIVSAVSIQSLSVIASSLDAALPKRLIARGHPGNSASAR
jgi:hypothetical protein